MSEDQVRSLISIWIIYLAMILSVMNLMASYGLTNEAGYLWLRTLIACAFMARPLAITYLDTKE